MAIKENDTSNAICNHCKKLVATMYKVRPYSINKNIQPVKILAGVCDICDSTITIPAQSTKIIKKHREKYEQN